MLTQTPNADPNANLDLNLAGGVSKLAGRHADISDTSDAVNSLSMLSVDSCLSWPNPNRNSL